MWHAAGSAFAPCTTGRFHHPPMQRLAPNHRRIRRSRLGRRGPFIFPKREQVLDALFAPDGLHANILRGEIFPHYATGKLQADFATASDTSLHVAQHPEKVERNDLLRRGQFWLTSHVQQKYPEVRFTFSTWSPPP